MNKSEFHKTLFGNCGEGKSEMQVIGGHSRYFVKVQRVIFGGF